MGLQLVYTSAPKLLQGGRTGFGTVAAHPQIRPLLREKLEKISKFSRLAGLDPHRIIFYHRVVQVSGETYSVVSRICDSGVDYTGRTNHIAHHLIFTSAETYQLGAAGVTPADLAIWAEAHNLWLSSWPGDPKEMTPEHEIDVAAVTASLGLPATHWGTLLGSPGRAAVLAPGESAESCWLLFAELLRGNLLTLLGEAMLLHPRPWQITFSTDLQPVDQTDEIRWRCVCHGSPVAADAARSVRPSLDLAKPESLQPVTAFVTLAETGRAASTAQPVVRGSTSSWRQQSFSPGSNTTAGHPSNIPQQNISRTVPAGHGPSLEELKKLRKFAGSEPTKRRRSFLKVAGAVVASLILLAGSWLGWRFVNELSEHRALRSEVINAGNDFTERWGFPQSLEASSLKSVSLEDLQTLSKNILADAPLLFSRSQEQLQERISALKAIQRLPKAGSTGATGNFLLHLQLLFESAIDFQKAQAALEGGDFENAWKAYEPHRERMIRLSDGAPRYEWDDRSAPWVRSILENWREVDTWDPTKTTSTQDITSTTEMLNQVLKNYANIEDVREIPAKALADFDALLAKQLQKWAGAQNAPINEDTRTRVLDFFRKLNAPAQENLPTVAALLAASATLSKLIAERNPPDPEMHFQEMRESADTMGLSRLLISEFQPVTHQLSLENSSETTGENGTEEQVVAPPEIFWEVESQILARIKEKFGEDFPVVARLDGDEVANFLRGIELNLQPTPQRDLGKLAHGAVGVLSEQDGEKIFYLNHDRFTQPLGGSSFNIVLEGPLVPQYNPETKEIILSPNLLARINAKIDSDPPKIRLQNRAATTGGSEFGTPLNNIGPISASELLRESDAAQKIQELEKDIRDQEEMLNAEWTSRRSAWNKIEYHDIPEYPSKISIDSLLDPLIAAVDSEADNLKKDKSSKGRDTREKRVAELVRIRSTLARIKSGEETIPATIKKLLQEALEKLDPSKLAAQSPPAASDAETPAISDEQQQIDAKFSEAADAAVFFLFDYPKIDRGLKTKKAQLDREKQAAQTVRDFFANPLPYLSIGVFFKESDEKPTIIYHLASPTQR